MPTDLTPLEALDRKLAALRVWNWMHNFVGRDDAVPSEVDWRDERTLLRGVIPTVWTQHAWTLAMAAFRDLQTQISAGRLQAPTMPEYDPHGVWDMWPESVLTITDGLGTVSKIDGLITVPVRRGLPATPSVAIRFMQGPVMIAFFEIDVGEPIDAFIARMRSARPDDDRWEVECMAALAISGIARIFREQRIMEHAVADIPRHGRKRARAAEVDPVVHVVRLRRSDHAPAAHSGEEAVAWTCRWLVRGHWRQQWHPSTQRHQLRWITPYIKGPADKPLREPAPTVQVVQR